MGKKSLNEKSAKQEGKNSSSVHKPGKKLQMLIRKAETERRINSFSEKPNNRFI